MNFLTKQVRLFDWNDRQIGQYDLLKGIYVIGTIITHAFGEFIYGSLMIPGPDKLITALRLVFFALIEGSNSVLMIVCGLQFRKKSSMRGAIRSQVMHLWKPYLYTVLAVFIAVFITSWITGGDIWAETIRKVLPFVLGNVDNISYFGIPAAGGCGSMWFIIVFVASGIMLNAVLQIKDSLLQWITVILLYVTGTFSGIWVGIPQQLPFGLYRGMRYTLYMYIGWQIKKTNFFEKRFPVWMLIFAAYITAHCVFLRQSNVFVCFIIAFGLIAAAQWLDKRKWRFLNGLRWLGRMIMPFCCIHTVFSFMFPSEFINLYFSQKPALFIVVLVVIYIVTSIGGCVLLDRIKRRRIMRKRYKAIGGN